MLLWYILLGVAVAILALVVLIALRPANFRVVRSASITAAPADVFAQVNDLHRWAAWSPWDKIDPALVKTYEGAPSGTGAVYGWKGNRQVGEGRMTIIESRPSEFIRIKLEFFRPFAGVNDVQFTFVPDGRQTVVTWAMDGKLNFVTKAFSLFMSMDRMIGGMYEQGLAQLKSLVEATPKHG
jgi:hypothetical protein